MSDKHCPTCGPAFSGAYNDDLRCVTCGGQVEDAPEDDAE